MNLGLFTLFVSLIFFFFAENEVIVTTAAPPRLFYNLQVKLINLGENFKIPPAGTSDFETLSNQIGNNFEGVLENVPGFHKIEVNDISG